MEAPVKTGRGSLTTPVRFFLVVLILAGICFIPPAAALKVSGSKYMETLSPGSTALHTITLEADTGTPMDVGVDVAGFANGPDGAYLPVAPADDSGRYSARTFITLDKSAAHLVPGTPVPITATIRVPPGTPAGGRYAIIYIHSVPKETGSVGFITAIAVPVMVTVSGGALTETGSITGISAGAIATGQPFTVTTGFRQTGNHHYYHISDTVVVSGAGGVVANGSTGPVAYAIIPGNTIQFRIPVDAPLASGTYTITSTVRNESGAVLDSMSVPLTVARSYIPPPKSATITLTPREPGELRSPDGRYEVLFPAGSVLSTVQVTLSPAMSTQIPPATGGIRMGTSSFTVSGLTGLLAQPATVKVIYSDSDLTVANGAASSLRLARFDEAAGSWTVLPTTLDRGVLTTRSDRMGTWAVVSSAGGILEAEGPAANPAPGSQDATGTIVAAVAIILILIAAGIVLVRKNNADAGAAAGETRRDESRERKEK